MERIFYNRGEPESIWIVGISVEVVDMKKRWKRMLAICCAVVIAMTMPGMSVLADELQEDEIIVTEADDPTNAEQTEIGSEFIEENVISKLEESVNQLPEDGIVSEIEENTAQPSEGEIIDESEITVGASPTIIQSGVCGNSATWKLDDAGTLIINGSGDMTNYDNAESVPWKSYRSSIKKVFIGNNITSIGSFSFYGCSLLANVTFEATSKVSTIYRSAFKNCNGIKNITLPKSVVYSRGMDIYRGCTSLVKISGYCGDDCTWEYNRTNLTLSIDGKGRMYDYVYQNSASSFSSNIKWDGTEKHWATPWFSFVDEIKHVVVLGSVSYIGQGAFGSLGSKWDSAFTKLESIGQVESMTLSSSVKEFDDYAFRFSGCSSTVDMPLTESGKLPNMGNGTSFTSVRLADGYVNTGNAFSGSSSLKEVYLPDSITTISGSCFSGCSKLSKIVMSSNLVYIKDSAFYGCTGLKSVIIPSTVTSIEQDAFRDCSGLESVVFKGSLGTLSRGVFQGCTSLKSITFPKNLKSIGVASFFDCDSITSITIPEGVEAIYGGAFSNCDKLQEISLPASLKTLSYGAHNTKENVSNSFYSNPSLIKFSVATGNTTFASYNDCVYNKTLTELLFVPTAKKDILIPESVTSIGKYAFFNNEGYFGTSIRFRGNLTNSFPENVFENVTTTAYYPAGNSTWSQTAREKLGGTIVWKEWHPNISNCSISISPNSYTYDGNAKTPAVIVKDGSTQLTLGTHYSVSYTNNTNAGKATVKVNGINNYTGTKSVQFTINKATPVLKFASSSVTKNVTEAEFTNALTKKTDGYIGFISGDESVAIVDNNGKVKIIGEGTTTITANAAAGTNYIAGSVSYKLIIVDNRIKYTVTYNTNGGTGTPSSQTKIENVSLTLSSIKPTKQYLISYNSNGGSVSPSSKSIGCTFNNWNTAKNGSGTSYAPGGRYTVNASVTLYAQWKNPAAGELATPTRSGYIFTGWFTSATGGNQINSSSIVNGNITLYAHWTDPYNLGDETYSFENYTDSDDPDGHCFGMSMTSAGYMNKILDIKKIGGNDNTPLYSFDPTSIVKKPICYYQAKQGSYRNAATVAGGLFYSKRIHDIDHDWSEVINYVKNHQYDNTGLLQIGLRSGEDGHAVNFLYYKNVNGQDRIYAYDNNYPTIETYFYRDGNGSIIQKPISTLSGKIDCIALRDIRLYFKAVDSFDSTHVVYMEKDAAKIQGYSFSYMEGSDYVMYEIPADQKSVTIVPSRNNADFIYMDTEYSFGKISDKTRGQLTFSTLDENAGTTNERFVIYEEQSTSYKFSDVQDPTHAFYNAIYWAADAGITKGYPDGTFGIDRSCTRGEMIMFLWRYAGKPAAKAVTKSPFSDVPKTHSFYNAILWGSQKGITKGYPDGTFGINRNVSRGECMMFLWRLRGKPSPKAVSVSPFKDVPKTHAFYNAILWGAQKKITNGYTSGEKKGTFGINENCTRGAIVTFLYRAK